MEETESKEQLLVLLVAVAPGEGGLINQLIKTFHVGLQPLQEREEKERERGGEREREGERERIITR